ncbi:hypothetical protein EV426DRAFT_671298 [Tirmania nivea]|nr:hypothetical protein EV426DRAFT_671298 [Tirmania nivea]
MAAVDSWSDGWESIADREVVNAKSGAVEAAEGNGSSSGSSTTSNSSLTAPVISPTILSKKAPAEEENKKIWEAANASNPFEVVPSDSAPTKVVNFKPELKILKRAPPAAPIAKSANTNSESPAILDRKEKERRYAEARERLFGPASSTTSSESTTSSTTTLTVGMSRSSSSSGLPNKNGENGSGTTTPSRERGSGTRGGKKSGRGNSSGNNTPRSRSPGRGQRGDPNRTSGIVGGITKVTENGWVYTGTGQTPRTSSPASTKSTGVDSRVGSPGIVAVSAGIMSMNLNTTGGYNLTTNPHASVPGMPNQLGMGGVGSGPGVIGQRQQSGYFPPGQGYPSQQYFPPNQPYPVTQPLPQSSVYPGPLFCYTSQAQTYQPHQSQANIFTPYQTSGAPGPYMPAQQHPTLQQHSIPQSHLNYQRPYSQISTGPSPLSSSLSLPPRYEPIGGASRTVYLQDPNVFAPRPPLPQGKLTPGYGYNPVPGGGAADSLNPIRAPRGPDVSMGRGFYGRGGRGSGFDAS